MGTPPGRNSHKRRLRQKVGGWSPGSVRRNTAFLRSVDETQLSGEGWTFTLTVKDCPPDSREFHRMRRAYLKRLKRAGMIRLHWVIEWQRRGVPHLHGIAYFDPATERRTLAAALGSWLTVAADYGAAPSGQHIVSVTDAVGWLKYLAKHAARGVHHYQRSPESVPVSWKGETGRMWGHVGDWPREPVLGVELGASSSAKLRRSVRAWRKADARAEVDQGKRRRRIVQARTMLKCGDRNLSAVRGISEWIPADVMLRLLEALALQGHRIEAT